MATQSLYRRYRPRRFGEIKGQDHVVRALRDAVATGREGQAYLFSGPRGTGKTTSARILAKVLNCDDVVEGEPCCRCESCLAVERGTSYDVHELDAASNRGIDAMRDLIEKASLGTAGRHKVYILDEVHMLTKEAAAALLKTLEEPPPHVVFVLATTDPQKVIDTIRSRTQHLHFHLLPSDTLAEHVKWVADDAGLEVSQAALDAALVQGGGSPRDTLSALEVFASSGGDVAEVIDLDEFLTALVERDPGRVLTAMGHAVSMGRDPRNVTEELVRHLRNAFLTLMAPELVVLSADQLDRLAAQAQQLGAAALVRAIERLGATLGDMRHAPDPRILVEVALVQLTHDEAGSDAAALAVRLERLEQSVKELRHAGPAAAATSAPKDPSTGRAVLGGAARRPSKPEAATTAPDTATPSDQTTTPEPESAAPDTATPSDQTTTPEPESAASDVPPGGSAPASAESAAGSTPEVAGSTPEVAGSTPEVAAPGPASATPRSAISVVDAWEHTVKGQVKPLVRALYSAGSFIGNEGDTWQFSVPNEAHGGKCAEHRATVEAALSQAVGTPVTIEFVVGGRDHSGPIPSPTTGSASSGSAPSGVAGSPGSSVGSAPAEAAQPTAPAADDEIDLSELTDAPPESVKTPIDRLADAFPGSELVNDD